MGKGDISINAEMVSKWLNTRDTYKQAVFDAVKVLDKGNPAFEILQRALQNVYELDPSTNIEAGVLLDELNKSER